MNVRSILEQKGSSEVHTIGPRETVQRAVERLVEHGIGSLVVVDDGRRPVGIVTERDILRCCAAEPERMTSLRVEEVMTGDLIIGEPGDTVDYVMGVMTKNRIRHLPIVEGNDLRGLVSIGDVVRIQLEKTEYENRHLRHYITGTY